MVGATQAVFDAMCSVELRALRGALCGCQAVQQASGIPKPQFDRQVLRMALKGLVSLHRHDWPSSLTEAERSGMILAGGTYYVGFAIRLP